MTSSKRMMATVVLATCTACTSAFAESPRQFSGVAAFYSTNYSGRTACGERYDPKKYTAAHRSLPFGTRLRITDPRSQRSVIVVVNDRGPFTRGRVLDLSLAAAKALQMIDRGLMKVTAIYRIGALFELHDIASVSGGHRLISAILSAIPFSVVPAKLQGSDHARQTPGATPCTD